VSSAWTAEEKPGNAAQHLLGENLDRWPDRVAFIEGDRAHTYREVATRAARIGRGLLEAGLAPGDRMALCMHDGVELCCAFLGALQAGLLPMPLNTLLTSSDYAYILRDSQAAAALVSPPLSAVWSRAKGEAGWRGPLWTDPPLAREADPAVERRGAGLDAAFLLYSSGSTGRPKGVVHSHANLLATAESFAKGVLGLAPDDVVYSAAKLFFAYGLGNSLTFPLSVGAVSVLQPERVTPDVVWRVLRGRHVTVFCGVPTLFAALLASPDFPRREDLALRLCVSAGEPMPAEISRAWTARTGVEIVDGLGSTEMLHIFLCNRPGEIRHGVTGRPVPGYEAKLVGEDGDEAAPGELGELHVRGPSAALGYWNNPEKTAATFADGWVRTGDKFRRTETGDYVFCGRADDMLKVSGIWVSPAEVENTLIEHEAVHEAAVVGVTDAHGLVKAKAYVVLAPHLTPSDQLGLELQAFAKSRLAPHKYPRQIEFVPDLPRTATGKVRRHLLRDAERPAPIRR
jgi:benzoate-CoA ligase